MTKTQDLTLEQSVEKLTKVIRSRTSLLYRFWMGLVVGVGTAIGASVIAGVVIYVSSQLAEELNLDSYELIKQAFDRTNSE
jgi:hypothetical protein